MSDYDVIKAQELNFPIFRPVGQVLVGTFDAREGTFTYSVPTVIKHVNHLVGLRGSAHVSGSLGGDRSATRTTSLRQGDGDFPDDPPPGGDDQDVLLGGIASVLNAYSVELRFNIVNDSAVTEVTIGSTVLQVPAGEGHVLHNVGTESTAAFKLTCAGVEFVCETPLQIRRVMAAAGAITIPALPIAIVYAPPVDSRQQNQASLTTIDRSGVTTSFDVISSDSRTTPAPTPLQFASWMELSSEIGLAAKGAEIIGAQTVAKALNAIKDLLGTSTASVEFTTSSEQESAVTVTNTSTESIFTNPRSGGPGYGDVIVFLENARACWYSNGGAPKLAIVQASSLRQITVGDLTSLNDTGLSDQTRNALLQLDSLWVNGPEAVIQAPRFVRTSPYPIELAGSGRSLDLGYTWTQTDLAESVSTRVDIEDDTQAFLAALNIGVTQTQQLRVGITQKIATTTEQSKTVTRSLTFNAEPNEDYSVEVYTDVVFGTFAFREISETLELSAGTRTIGIPAAAQFLHDGGGTLSGFIPTGSKSDAMLATISDWEPGGGGHPTTVFVKRIRQGNVDGIWFRVNFVNDMPNGTTWITFYQGGSPTWPDAAAQTSVNFDSPPWH